MDNFAWLAALIPIIGIGAVVLLIVSVSKQDHAAGFKPTFYMMMALVTLMLGVGSIVSLISTIGNEKVLSGSDKRILLRSGMPPIYSVPNAMPTATELTKPVSAPIAAYACTDGCEFTTEDKSAFTTWKQQYQTWVNDNQPNQIFKRDIVAPLSFLIVAVPLFFLFWFLMNRGQAARPTPARSLYFYYVAFSSLIVTVVAAGFLINTGLKTWLKTAPTNQLSPVVTGLTTQPSATGLNSVINCAGKCGFSADDVQLAKNALAKEKDFMSKQPYGGQTNDWQTSVANTVPIILIGIPLFWFHFVRARKETKDGQPLTPAAA